MKKRGFIRRITPMLATIALTIGIADYVSSGVKRSSGSIELTLNMWPISVTSYIREFNGPDRLLIYKPMNRFLGYNDGVVINDYNRDGRPDEVSADGQEFSRYGKSTPATRRMFEKIDEVWDAAKKEMDVEARIELELKNEYTPEEIREITPDDIREFF